MVEEEDNQFACFLIKDGIERYFQLNGEDFSRDLSRHPRLKWRWRAHHLPEGASERDQNDTGVAVYVTFDTDWFGRPKSMVYLQLEPSGRDGRGVWLVEADCRRLSSEAVGRRVGA